MPDKQRIRRIFVVDDEPVIGLTLAMILCHHGFEATSFTNPTAALLAVQSEAPDLLLSDVVMPLLSGIELAIQVREYCPNCKVLLFSGQSAASNWAKAAPASGYVFEVLSKPVHPKELLQRIQSLIGGEPAASVQEGSREDVMERSA